MIAGASAAVSRGVLGQLASNSQSVKQQIDLVTNEVSTGLVSSSLSGLGSGMLPVLDLRPQIALNDTRSSAISDATGKMGVTQTALSQIASVADGILTQLRANSGSDSSNIDSIASQARDALGQVASLLNTKDGETFLFSGQDTANPPVPDATDITSSSYFQQISAAVQSLGSNGAAATESATLAIGKSDASGTTVFSAYLSAQSGTAPAVVTVDSGAGSPTAYGVLANANSSGVTSADDPASTGSYMRDILRALATVGSLSSSQSSASGYTAFLKDTADQLDSATSSLNAEAGVLGEKQDTLTATQTSLSSVQIALKSQLSDAEDSDVASLSTTLQLLQTQLQTSYKMISNMSSLSLVSFL